MARRKKSNERVASSGKPKAYVKVKIGGAWRQLAKTFDVGTDARVIDAWKAEQQGKYATPAASAYGTLPAMIDAYEPTIRAKPTYKQIMAHLDAWAAALGRERLATTITHLDIDRVMDLWARTPTVAVPGKRGRPSAADGLQAGTLIKRRATLRRLFNVVNTKSGFNPVRASARPETPDEPDEVRGLELHEALALVAAMPAWVYPRKGFQQPSGARARALVFIWTGFHPAILEQIKAADLFLDARDAATGQPAPYVIAPRRKKGGGVERRKVRLCPQAVDAFRALVAAGALGRFSPEAFNVSVKRAARRAGIPLPPGFSAYGLRHTFGAALAESGTDEAGIARLMLHAKNSTVGRRYTARAQQQLNARSVARLGELGVAAATLAASIAHRETPDAGVNKHRSPHEPAAQTPQLGAAQGAGGAKSQRRKHLARAI